jgi:hypothetical protein
LDYRVDTVNGSGIFHPMKRAPATQEAPMTTTTTPRDFTIGSREWKAASLAGEMRRHADAVDAFADAVEAWGESDRTARGALRLIEKGNALQANATRFGQSDFLGQSTAASFLNDASQAVGATNGVAPRGRGDVAYALMYALSQTEKYGEGTALANTGTKAASLRVHGASCRVIAGMLDSLAAGEIRTIR